MSRRIYEMERREEQARQARQARAVADKAASRASRHGIDGANDVPQANQNVLMEGSEEEQSIFGKAVVTCLSHSNISWGR